MWLSTILLFGAIVIFICLLCSRLSQKFGIPVLFLFILLGMIFGSDGIFKIHFDNFQFAESICSLALIFIIFNGGFTTKWDKAKKVAPMAVVLSSVGVILTAFLTGLFCFKVLHFEWLESLLIGATLSSTDAASVFSVLRSKQLNLKYGTASLLELESGSNDPCAYTLMVIILTMMSSTIRGLDIVSLFFKQIVFGIALGVLIALITIKILDYIDLPSSSISFIVLVGVAMLAYSLPDLVGGNGYISTYLVGIILGNHTLEYKKELLHFFDGIVELFQMFIFFLLGLLAFPSQMPNLILSALAIALFMTFIGRPLVCFVLMKLFHCPNNQIELVSFSGLRGASSIIFAIIVTVSDAYTKNDVFHITFCIVLFSLIFQGILLPYVAKKLDMIDDNENVLKTFTDYSEETNIQFLTLKIKEGHPWVNMMIKDMVLPPQTRLIMIQRDNKKTIPKGDVMMQAGDKVILSALESEFDDVRLTEIQIDKDHSWCNAYIKDLEMSHQLIALIKRNDEVLLPQGDVQLLDQDIVVFAHNV